KSGTPSASTNSGTTTTTASDSATAEAVSVVALSRPASTAVFSLRSRSCSPGKGSTPALTSSTTFSLTSAPMTRCPLAANCTASGSPILPSATTQMFMIRSLLPFETADDSGLQPGAQWLLRRDKRRCGDHHTTLVGDHRRGPVRVDRSAPTPGQRHGLSLAPHRDLVRRPGDVQVHADAQLHSARLHRDPGMQHGRGAVFGRLSDETSDRKSTRLNSSH